MSDPKLFLVLGIRPDVIRASIIIRELRRQLGEQFKLVWSGQHYSDNLKDIFFRELGLAPPEIELEITGDSDSELVASMIEKLAIVLKQEEPHAVVFLGDTNTVTGSIAAAQLNIPIVHIEGCMRSYDWRMPEEKYRTIADHLSDLIYAYVDEYRSQGLAEGIPSENIVVTGNPIVDVLHEYFLSGKLRMDSDQFSQLLKVKYGVDDQEYFVLTCHRRENVESKGALENIFKLAAHCNKKVLFPAGYRTQKMISELGVSLPKNVVLVDPVGYLELLELIMKSNGVLTDSGTVVEEAAVLGIPSVQMRTATERPQVYECGASIKFDPFSSINHNEIISKLLSFGNSKWVHPFGDGKASYRIVDDLIARLRLDDFRGHEPRKYKPFSDKAFMYESQ
jgi:UDP-N-acetylglucosamine 2-epimerase (non-hydrolysing)